MRRIFGRMFGGVGIFLRRLLGLGIPLWFVLAMVLGSLFATRIITRNQVVREVGGKDDFDEAMRYIEIKDIIDEKFIEPVEHGILRGHRDGFRPWRFLEQFPDG